MSNLYTFQGHAAATVYTLPPIQDSDKRQAHINRLQNAIQEMEETTGIYISAGANPMFPSYGEIQGTYEIAQGWLTQYPTGVANSSNNYKATFAGLETAIYDICVQVIGAGMGTFTENLPAGTVAGITNGGTPGAALTSRSCECFVHGDYTFERKAGAPIAVVTLTFLVPSCQWTYSSGALVPFS